MMLLLLYSNLILNSFQFSYSEFFILSIWSGDNLTENSIKLFNYNRLFTLQEKIIFNIDYKYLSLSDALRGG